MAKRTGPRAVASKQLRTEDALEQLHALRRTRAPFDLERDLAPFLRHKSNHVIAAAARIAQEAEAESLTPHLIAAFTELLPHAAVRDRGCTALTAVAEALASMGQDAAEVYEKGVRYTQMEGSFGPPVDTASLLRGVCARGLVRMRHPLAMEEAVLLLTDREVPARIGALRAFADSGSREAELVVRFKIHAGDKAEEVVAECFNTLLTIAGDRAIPLVAARLDSAEEAIVEAAALALGESRRPAALPYLTAAFGRRVTPTLRRALLLGIAMLRQPEGVEFLLACVGEENAAVAAAALDALALYQSDNAVRTRVRKVLEARRLEDFPPQSQGWWS